MSNKKPISQDQLLKLEGCSHINFLTRREKEFIDNFRSRYSEYGDKTVITESQSEFLDSIYMKWVIKESPPLTDFMGLVCKSLWTLLNAVCLNYTHREKVIKLKDELSQFWEEELEG